MIYFNEADSSYLSIILLTKNTDWLIDTDDGIEKNVTNAKDRVSLYFHLHHWFWTHLW